MKSTKFEIRTSAREEARLITSEVVDAIGTLGVSDGFCMVYTPHTTAALTINEDADPDVRTDLVAAFRAMVPPVGFRHGEGNSDAHLMSSLIGISVTVPMRGGRLLLGRWQGIWFVELDGPRRREVSIHVVSDA